MSYSINRRSLLIGSGGLSLAGIAAVGRLSPESGNAQMDASPEAHGSPMAMGGGAGAAYMTITNTGTEDDVLTGGSTSVAMVAEIHEMSMDGDVMMMTPLPDGLVIPAGGSVTLEPAGYHVMLIGLLQDLKPNTSYTLTLTFEQAGSVDIVVPVYPTEGLFQAAQEQGGAEPVTFGPLQIAAIWTRMAPMLASGSPMAMPEGTPNATPDI